MNIKTCCEKCCQ